MPSTRSAPQPPAKVSHKKEKKAVKKKPTPPKTRVASEESDGSEDGADKEVEIARPAPAALATVESIEKSIAEQQRELARLKAKAVLERRMAALAEEITLLNDKQGMAASLAKTAKASSSDKKSKKRARAEAASSEDDSSLRKTTPATRRRTNWIWEPMTAPAWTPTRKSGRPRSRPSKKVTSFRQSSPCGTGVAKQKRWVAMVKRK